MNFEQIQQIPPYSLDKKDKEKLLTERLLELTEHHRESCQEYRCILNAIS